MKISPKVAVITRTKDRGILLERAIKSVHQQTMKDFVHVIINDGGDAAVVNRLVKKYSRIIEGRVKVIHNKKSGGMEAASNKAIKSVESHYVAIHDDDDSWHPTFLEKTLEAMTDSGMPGAIVNTDMIIEEVTGESVQELARHRWMPHLRTLSLYDLCLDNFAVPISFIYKREVYDEIGYYDETLPVCGDWDFALRFMKRYDICHVESAYALAYYHHRQKSTGALGNSIFARADIHERHRVLLENKYLRNDVNSGGLGLGYLFNHLRKEREFRDNYYNQLQEVMDKCNSLEGVVISRTDYKAKVRKVADKVSPKIYKSIKKIVR